VNRLLALAVVLLGVAGLALLAAVYYRPQPRSDFQRQLDWCRDALKQNLSRCPRDRILVPASAA
jgi:hypothetical protein